VLLDNMNYRIIEGVTDDEEAKKQWFLYQKADANTTAMLVGIFDSFDAANTVLAMKREENKSGN
jgi:hypothetical protein